MATRGRIGVLRPDGRVESIYNHYDSYPEHLGDALSRKFLDPKTVDELISLGDRSSLYADDDYDIRNPKHVYTTDKQKFPSRFDDSEDVFWDNDDDWDIDYKYLYVPTQEGGEWYVNGKRKPFVTYKNPAQQAEGIIAERTPLKLTNPQAAINGGQGAITQKLLGSKSKFAQKYPDRYEKVKNLNVYGEGRTAEDVDWDDIAGILGVDID